MQEESNNHLKTIRLLEEGMWTYETRSNEHWVNSHFHPDFVEVGRSGKRYSRADFFPVSTARFEATIPLANFKIQMLSPSCALTTYDSLFRQHKDAQEEYAHRSSIWQFYEARWQLLYHQGTPFY